MPALTRFASLLTPRLPLAHYTHYTHRTHYTHYTYCRTTYATRTTRTGADANGADALAAEEMVSALRGFFKGGKATEDRFVATIEPFARKALAECTALKERFEALEASFHGLVERFGENKAKVRGDYIV